MFKKFAIAILFLITILISETIFIIKNRPDVTAPLFLWSAKQTAKINIELSLLFLEKAAQTYTKSNIISSTPNIGSFEGFGENKIDINPEFVSKYQKYVANINQDFKTTNQDKIAFYYYKLGVLAYYNNEPELGADLMDASTHIYPETGYNHIEHANIYLQYKDFIKAQSILDKCYQFQNARKWCEEYRDGSLYINKGQPVGFLEKHIIDTF